MKLVNLGFNNSVMLDKIIAVVASDAAPMKRLREEARKQNRLIDATSGRKTRSIVITDSNHVILSCAQTDTLVERIKKERS